MVHGVKRLLALPRAQLAYGCVLKTQFSVLSSNFHRGLFFFIFFFLTLHVGKMFPFGIAHLEKMHWLILQGGGQDTNFLLTSDRMK